VSAPAGRPPVQADDIHIDRLALRVAGLNEDAAGRLARLVAERLAPSLLQLPGLAGVESLRVAVQAAADEQGNPDLMAQRIVDEIGRVLARDRVSAGPDGEVAR
jgi:hypothetical protein